MFSLTCEVAMALAEVPQAALASRIDLGELIGQTVGEFRSLGGPGEADPNAIKLGLRLTIEAALGVGQKQGIGPGRKLTDALPEPVGNALRPHCSVAPATGRGAIAGA